MFKSIKAKEIWHALEALEKAEEAQRRGALPFAFFPHAVQERLERFDETGHGVGVPLQMLGAWAGLTGS